MMNHDEEKFTQYFRLNREQIAQVFHFIVADLIIDISKYDVFMWVFPSSLINHFRACPSINKRTRHLCDGNVITCSKKDI